eukprot:CAMPEP_0194032528 /NCGR_PEP_ID=MMETSP0009_2-20130614/5452_1 /TAXON_ID=210454 /ORGANISM="Grammatophora oceanica, Strain CCMP 410" /LENGTH=624 /DNA_ID=CAMNT_0038672997 /DNA_START=404 /DNA_END=2278 /DNA_ORIENTATION=+
MRPHHVGIAFLLVSLSSAQELFTTTSLPVTTAASATTDDCPLVDCCDDDCCGAGTSWNGTECVSNPLSRGWNGFGASIPAAGDQCFPRICCEERCCGAGLEYVMGRLRRQCLPIGATPSPTPAPIALVPPGPSGSTAAPTDGLRNGDLRKLVEGQCAFIETISYELDSASTGMETANVQLQRQSHGDCSGDVMSGLGWFRYMTPEGTMEDVTGSEMMLAPIVSDENGKLSLQGAPLPDDVIIAPATRRVSAFTTIDVTMSLTGLDLAFANKVRCFCKEVTNTIQEFPVRFRFDEGSSEVESNADQVDVDGSTIKHTWFHMLNCDETDEQATPIYDEFQHMMDLQDGDDTDDTTMTGAMTTIESMVNAGVQTYPLALTESGPRAVLPSAPRVPTPPVDKSEGSCAWLQSVSYEPGASSLQVELQRQSDGVCAGELMSELGWFRYDTADGTAEEITGADIAGAPIVTDDNGRMTREGSPLPDGVSIGPVTDKISAFTTIDIDASLDQVDLAFINKIRCYCDTETNVVDEFAIRFKLDTTTGTVTSNAGTVLTASQSDDGTIKHTWNKLLKCDSTDVGATPTYDLFLTYMEQQDGSDDMTTVLNDIESMISSSSYNLDGTSSGRRYR